MVVTAASGAAPGISALDAAFPLAAGETATIPSTGRRPQAPRPARRTRMAFTSVDPVRRERRSTRPGVPYVSDFSVSSMQSTETVVGLELWTSAGRRESSLIRLPAYGSKTIRDVVKSAFGLEQTFGALLVSSTGYVTAGARTWAPVPGGGTNGQFALAGDVRSPSSSAILLTGETGVLTGVRQDLAFRTNVGVYNLSEKECRRRGRGPGRRGPARRVPVRPLGSRDPLRAAVARRRHRKQPPVGLRPPDQRHVGLRRRGCRLRDRQRHAGPVRRLAAQELLTPLTRRARRGARPAASRLCHIDASWTIRQPPGNLTRFRRVSPSAAGLSA